MLTNMMISPPTHQTDGRDHVNIKEKVIKVVG
jgi:hypothetical protein